MARKNRGSHYEDDLPGLDISSLIDVCFLLLIYFIVTTTIEASEQDVDMKLPSGVGKGESDIEPMFIKIDATGAIYTGVGASQEQLDTDGAERTVPLLAQRIELYKSNADLTGSDPVVQISISGDAKQQRALDVLNCLSKYKIKSVTFTDLMD